MDEFIDRELAAHEAALVREHLETCAACASEYSFEANVLLTVKAKLRRVAVPDELRARIERSLSGGTSS